MKSFRLHLSDIFLTTSDLQLPRVMLKYPMCKKTNKPLFIPSCQKEALYVFDICVSIQSQPLSRLCPLQSEASTAHCPVLSILTLSPLFSPAHRVHVRKRGLLSANHIAAHKERSKGRVFCIFSFSKMLKKGKGCYAMNANF